MVKIRAVSDPTMVESRRRSAKPKELSPRARARLEQERLFRTRVINRLSDPSKWFRVRLEPDDKAATVRRRLNDVAKAAGKEIAIRRAPDGFYVSLMTPERRSRRGRPPKARA